MFETTIDKGPSAASWLAQQFGVPIISLLWALTTAQVGDRIKAALGSPAGDVVRVAWYALFIWGSGLLLSLFVHRLIPRSGTEGRWIWILPSLGFVTLFIDDLRHFPIRQVSADFFYPGDNGEGWWALVLATYPTAASIGYSLGMTYLNRRTDSAQKR
jgi:hypothetical protein